MKYIYIYIYIYIVLDEYKSHKIILIHLTFLSPCVYPSLTFNPISLQTQPGYLSWYFVGTIIFMRYFHGYIKARKSNIQFIVWQVIDGKKNFQLIYSKSKYTFLLKTFFKPTIVTTKIWGFSQKKKKIPSTVHDSQKVWFSLALN